MALGKPLADQGVFLKSSLITPQGAPPISPPPQAVLDLWAWEVSGTWDTRLPSDPLALFRVHSCCTAASLPPGAPQPTALLGWDPAGPAEPRPQGAQPQPNVEAALGLGSAHSGCRAGRFGKRPLFRV